MFLSRGGMWLELVLSRSQLTTKAETSEGLAQRFTGGMIVAYINRVGVVMMSGQILHLI